MSLQFEVTWMRCSELQQHKSQPTVALARPFARNDEEAKLRRATTAVNAMARVGKFLTIKNSLLLPPAEQEWSVVTSGDYVMVPVNAYRTEFKARSSLLATGISLGCHFGVELFRHTNCEPDKIHLFIGDDVVEILDTYRVYVGLAAVYF